MKTILAILFLLFASPTLAADGDPCIDGRTFSGGGCWLLCDDALDASPGACTEFRIPSFYSGALAIELQYSSCTAAIVAVTQTSVPGDSNADLLTTLTVGGTETVHIDPVAAHPLTYLTATTSGMTACTLDVRFHAR